MGVKIVPSPGGIVALPRLIRPSITGGSPRPELPKRWKEPIVRFQEVPSIESVLTTTLLHGHLYWRLQEHEAEDFEGQTRQSKSFEPMQTLELDWDWSPNVTEADFRAYAFGPWKPAGKKTGFQRGIPRK